MTTFKNLRSIVERSQPITGVVSSTLDRFSPCLLLLFSPCFLLRSPRKQPFQQRIPRMTKIKHKPPTTTPTMIETFFLVPPYGHCLDSVNNKKKKKKSQNFDTQILIMFLIVICTRRILLLEYQNSSFDILQHLSAYTKTYA